MKNQVVSIDDSTPVYFYEAKNDSVTEHVSSLNLPFAVENVELFKREALHTPFPDLRKVINQDKDIVLLNINHAKFLEENQDLIPAAWRTHQHNKEILFMGTTYAKNDFGGGTRCYVPMLVFSKDNNRWYVQTVDVSYREANGKKHNWWFSSAQAVAILHRSRLVSTDK